MVETGKDRLPTSYIFFLISPPLTAYPLPPKLKSNPLPQKDNSEESENEEKEKREGKEVMNSSVSHE